MKINETMFRGMTEGEIKRVKREIAEQRRLDALQKMKDGYVGHFNNPICRKCIQDYKKNKQGHRIDCRGIPTALDWVHPKVREQLNDDELAAAIILADPIRWAKAYLNWDAYEYQENTLQCSARRKVCRFGRRSGKSTMMAVDILHGLVTQAGIPLKDGKRYGASMLLITPYNDQVTNIFDMMEDLLNMNAELANSVVRWTKNPHMLKLSNGSHILGKPAGTKSGSEATAVRGQGSDRIYIDEGDYLSDGDYGTVMPIMTDHDHTRLFISSTPTGKRQRFYSYCHSKVYKEFHVPSMDRPNWNQQMEDEARADCPTELHYIHEFCLDGDQELDIVGRNPIAIRDIEIGMETYGPKGEVVKIVDKRMTGEKNAVEHITPFSSIVCTDDHGMANRLGLKQPINELTEIAYPYQQRYLLNATNDERYARLVGFINGDGTVTSRGRYVYARFYGEKVDLEAVCVDINILYGTSYKPYFKSSSANCETWCVEVNSTISKDLADKGAVVGRKVEQHWTLPSWILNQHNDSLLKEYYGALYGAEGSIPSPINYGYHSLSLSMSLLDNNVLKHFRTLLAIYGIESTLKSNTIYIKDFDSIERFCNMGIVRYNRKKEILCHHIMMYSRFKDYWYSKKFETYEEIKRLTEKYNLLDATVCAEFGVNQKYYSRWKTGKRPKPIKGRKYTWVKEIPKFEEWLDGHTNNHVCYMPIIDTRSCGVRPVYNITVDSRDHSYILANGMHTFNCAEFGEAEGGVFPVRLVEASRGEYANASDDTSREAFKYREPQDDWIYTIGVDQNEVAGTYATVLGWDPETQYFYVVDRQGVSKAEFTQIEGMELILRLNKKWRPEYIYIDKKPSSTAFELLKRHGQECRMTEGAANPDSMLAFNLKEIDFGAKMEVKDLRGQMTKRSIKPFMIGIAVRRFEQDQIRLPVHDKVLFQQLVDYTQRVTPAGNTIYEPGPQGDHALDSFILSVFAMAMEFAELGQSRNSVGMALSGGFGAKEGADVEYDNVAVVPRAIHIVNNQGPSGRYNSSHRLDEIQNRRSHNLKRGYYDSHFTHHGSRGVIKRRLKSNEKKTNLRRY